MSDVVSCRVVGACICEIPCFPQPIRDDWSFFFLSTFAVQSRRGGEGQQLVLVGPKCLPTGLPTSTAPGRVLESFQEEIKKQPDKLAAAFAVAQAMAKTTHIEIQVNM